jgi:hypothetical protein
MTSPSARSPNQGVWPNTPTSGSTPWVANISLPPMDVPYVQANGAFQMARLAFKGVKESDLPIAKFVK